jgi:WhiB family redox-sensing transcriptional regulator
MWNHGHQHSELLLAIEAVGGVPCSEMPDLFFPEDIPDEEVRNEAIKTAKSICKGCPIKWQCFEYATTTGQENGVWAGTLPHER